MGELVRIRREAAGFRTQKHLADEIGKGQSWLSRLESGAMKEIPPPGDLALLEEAIGVSQAEMLSAAGYDVVTGTEGDSAAVAAVRAILGNREFTDEEIAHLASIVQTMVSALKGRR